MSKHNLSKIAAASAIAFALAAGGATAYAKEGSETPADEARVLSAAKVSMSEAISAAEKATGGKTIGSGIEDQDGAVYFEVEILKDNARQKVLVDTQTGEVVKSLAAENDSDKGED